MYTHTVHFALYIKGEKPGTCQNKCQIATAMFRVHVSCIIAAIILIFPGNHGQDQAGEIPAP